MTVLEQGYLKQLCSHGGMKLTGDTYQYTMMGARVIGY